MAYPKSASSTDMYVGIGKQTVKGTGVTPTLFVPYRNAVSLDAGMAGEAIHEAGTGPYVNRQMKTAHDPNGAFGCGARPNTVGRLAAWFFGADSISGAGPYVHTITPATEARIWLSLEQAAGASGDIIERFVDALLKSMTVSCQGNQDIMFAFNWFSLTSTWIASAGSPTYESGLPGTAGANLRARDIAYTLDGDAEANVESFEIAWEWKYDESIRLSAVTRADALKLELTGKVKVKQLLNDTDTMNGYRRINLGSNSGTAPAPDFVGTGALIVTADNGLSSTNDRECVITVPAIDWTMAKYTDLDPSGATLYVEREGIIRKDSGAFSTIAAKTSDSSAYI